ncbi:MAG: hypothetical protein MI919_35270 [Holophagales bacterium]|nr:hypothetical protein [Holophagales bacterium]
MLFFGGNPRPASRKSTGWHRAGAAVSVVLLILNSPSVPAEEWAWWQHYELALERIAAGDGAGARQALGAALELRPLAGLHLSTEGLRSVDYLPHLHLAIAAHLDGDATAAREHLEEAEAVGAAERSEAGNRMLEAYRSILRAPPAGPSQASPTPSTAAKPGFADYPRRPVVLSDREAAALEARVLRRCGLDESIDRAQAPWYYHYELGLELAEHGDPQRALDALISAVERRESPQRSARLYGMWFIDYLPYFQIARLHATLGNRSCALDALRLSESKGEVTPVHDDYEDWTLLQRELEEP